MKKANRLLGWRRRVSATRGVGSFSETALRGRLRWLTVGAAAIGCWITLAVRNGAQQVDSGWAVAVPSPLPASTPASPEQQIVIRKVLEQTPQQLTRKAAPPTAAQAAAEHAAAGLRFAARPDAADGWRPAGQSPSPLGADWSRHLGSPQLAAPGAPAQIAEEAECDCSGAKDTTAKSVAQPPGAPARLPAPGVAAPQPTLATVPTENPAAASTAKEPTTATTTEPTVAGKDSIMPEAGAESPSAESAAKDAPATQPSPAEVKSQPQVAASAPTSKAPTGDIGPITEQPPLSRQLLSLRTRVRAVLKGYYRKALSSRENDPWEAMHGMLAYGVHSRIHDGGPNGDLITSVGWLCYNKPCKGQTLLYVTPAGELRAKYGVGLQGHLGQFLAMLAQCHVSPDYPIHVGDHEFTIKDLIEAEKKTCYPKSELTFKLIALQHYADLNDKWVNDQGLDWDFPRLVREELAQPIRGAACGGTHRLSGLSLVVKTRLKRGEPLDGEYQRADEFVKKYQQYAFRLQNRDGSLSTSWFRGAGDDDDINRRIKTSGHILEWLCYSLTDDQLREPQTVRAVTYLANLMYSNYDNEWEIGPRSHATHALLLYDQRVFQPYDKAGEVAVYRPTPSIAKRAQGTTIRR